VADAFDAMTSARAYRPARGSADALAELRKCAGAQFDAEVVQALARALPYLTAPASAPRFETEFIDVPRRMTLVGKY
jgi:HD-GYP domain-containing protein (c-di-GMP phosphodiesterase class II)